LSVSGLRAPKQASSGVVLADVGHLDSRMRYYCLGMLPPSGVVLACIGRDNAVTKRSNEWRRGTIFP
jgi:hypothetical protein